MHAKNIDISLLDYYSRGSVGISLAKLLFKANNTVDVTSLYYKTLFIFVVYTSSMHRVH